jgi:hypothetical protein
MDFEAYIIREIKNGATSLSILPYKKDKKNNNFDDVKVKDIEFFINNEWFFCIKSMTKSRQIIDELFKLIFKYRDECLGKHLLKTILQPHTKLTKRIFKQLSEKEGSDTKAKEYLKSVGYTEQQISEVLLRGEHNTLANRTKNHLIAVKKDLINYPFSSPSQPKLLKAIDDFLQNPLKYFPPRPKIKANVDEIRAFLKNIKVSEASITELITYITPPK